MIIRAAKESDAVKIAEIYNHYILESSVTFENAPVDGEEIAARIAELQEQDLPWFVADDTARGVIGYAYASKWKGRCAYRYSAEVTVYLSPAHFRAGTGSCLYTALFDRLKSLGYHTVIAGISLPNPASVGLHETFGMEKCSHFKQVGFKFGQWVDVGYWQGFLNPESP